LLEAWRALDHTAPLDDEAVAHVLDILGVKPDAGLTSAVAHARMQAASSRAAPAAAAQTASVAYTQRPKAELFAYWLADAVLAARLGWQVPLPLLPIGLTHSSLRRDGRRPYPGDGNWACYCSAAYALAAIAACDLYSQLEIPAAKLLALVPQLRSKGAPMVVERLLNEDAVLPSALKPFIGDRSTRRLFPLLVHSGGVRQVRERADRFDTPLYALL
jgi:hypothetical protein